MRNVPALFDANGSVIVEKRAPENHQNLGKILCRNGGPDRANGPGINGTFAFKSVENRKNRKNRKTLGRSEIFLKSDSDFPVKSDAHKDRPDAGCWMLDSIDNSSHRMGLRT